MARVILDVEARRQQRFEDREDLLYARIDRDREAKHLTKADMAGNIGMSPQLFGYKMKNHGFTTLDLIKIISCLNWTGKELERNLGKEY